MKFDLTNLNWRESHNLLADAVVPRPIAWISTVDENGIFNLAPFSFYAAVSVKPALLGVEIGTNRYGQKKDTLVNIECSKEFVVNLVTEGLAEAMNVTGTPYPSDVDEFKEVGLTPVKADLVKAPMVAESPINMECRLLQILEFGEAPQKAHLVIGEVLRMHVKDELYVDGVIRMDKLKVIARLGGEPDLYCRTTDTFKMKRPDEA